ncbi:MAG TPA: hypothetical protein VIU12_27390 [Chryseolinea sp.]
MNGSDSETLVKQVEDRDCSYVPEEICLDKAWNWMQRDKRALMLVGTSQQLNGILDEENSWNSSSSTRETSDSVRHHVPQTLAAIEISAMMRTMVSRMYLV